MRMSKAWSLIHKDASIMIPLPMRAVVVQCTAYSNEENPISRVYSAQDALDETKSRVWNQVLAICQLC